jgi:hypothetical protein
LLLLQVSADFTVEQALQLTRKAVAALCLYQNCHYPSLLLPPLLLLQVFL